MMNKIILIIANVLLLAGAVMAIANIAGAVYVFGVGSMGVLYLALQQIWKDAQNDKRKSRLYRINLMMSLMLLLGAYFMYIGSNSWVVALLIYALTVLFLSTRTK